MQGAETPLHFDERENLFFQAGSGLGLLLLRQTGGNPAPARSEG